VIEVLGWAVLIAAGWLGIALLAGLVIGRGIRIAEETEQEALDHEIERELHWTD
jgi:hypothetical protein